MKFRYIKVTGDLLWGKNNISKNDLAQVAQGNIETIIDLENMTQFDAENNEWKEIKGDL